MEAILTEYERLRLMVEAEADRLAPEYALQIISMACSQGGFDFGTALRTYIRDGVPWYVTHEKAALLQMSIAEQLARRAA